MTIRINKLYARIRVLHDRTQDMLFTLSFHAGLSYENHQTIREVQKKLGEIYGKKKL